MTTQTLSDLDRSLGWLLEEEGGWSDHPADRGGKTFNGVTQATYDDWRVRVVKKPKQSVRSATAAEIRDLYEIMYWRAAACDRLPWPLNYVTFDAAVNSGVSRATRWLQAGLGVAQDGKAGPATLDAANRAVREGNAASLLAVVDQRIQFLVALVRRDARQLAFLLGWWRRTQRVLGRSLLTVDEKDS